MKKLLFLLALLPLFLLAQNSWVNVQLLTDDYPGETSWSITPPGGSPIIAQNEPNLSENTLYNDTILVGGDVVISLYDSYGDGLGASQWGGTDGWFLVQNDCQDTLFYAAGNFGEILVDSLTIAPCAPPTGETTLGCMDENAINYNPDADINDLTLCEYPPCESIDNIYVEQTCDGGLAILYYNWDTSDNPNCNITQITYGSDGTNSYTFDTDIDNGIWGVYAGNGTMPPNWEDEFYAQFTTSDSLVSDTVLFTPYPCTQGCTDENAPNYNPWATVDDGSCGGQACEYGYVPLTIEVTLDNWPGETGWSFVSGDGSTEISDGTYTYQDVGQTYTYNVCAMESGFEFIISDTFGDGMAGSTSGGTMDGDVVIKGCDGEVITSLSSNTWVNAEQDTVGVGFGSVAYSTWQQTTICGGVEEVLGCTDFDYQEFNPAANTDDGSCLNEHVFGCINENAFNYDSLATQMEIYPNCNYELWIGDAGADGWGNSFLGVVQGDNQWTFTMGPGEYEQTFPIWLETDEPVKVYYFEVGGAQTPPEEVEFQTLHNSFKLTNANGNVLLYEGWNPFADNGQGALQSFSPPFYNTYNAMPFCGTLCIQTVLGCTDSEALNYNENANTDDGNCIEIVEGCTNDLAYNYNENANFDDDSCIPVVVGCMDDVAWNYNENANVGDDSCLYFGCTDSEAINYNYIANVDNGSCLYPGCTDSSALNFNSEANTDDGSCILPVYGCTDFTAFNYDSDANTDNDSCIPVIEGCTNIFAFNYDAFANTDDGSCLLTVYGCTDPTALNYDSEANVDNDSCIEIVEGCTDSTAFNYNVNANIEDFSCIDIVYGCTDENAFNYDSLANTDNGTCIDTLLGCTDIAAYNYNSMANTDNGSCVYDAECSGGPGVPYWLPNECFEWVISIDTECCTGDWNLYCVELYNYCDLGWPIDLEEMNSELLIYPNPVSDILNITQEIDIKLYDMVGNLVIFKEKTTKIDMTNLPKGIYNLNITYNNKTINNKIVKQ